MLEKDVRYLDSRIALLIQNRMALEEVRAFDPAKTNKLTQPSKTKLLATLMSPQKFRKASFLMMSRRRSMEISCFYCSLSRGISPISVASFRWPKSTHCSKPSCLPFMETSTRAEKSISCSPCSKYVFRPKMLRGITNRT